MNAAPENLGMENQVSPNEKIIIGGRKERVTVEDVLNAVRKYRTDSPSELAEKLECTRMTVYRKLQEIPREKIDAIFKELSESELKPAEMERPVFMQLPEMQEYRKMLERNQVSPKTIDTFLNQIYYVCIYLKIRPRSFTIDKIESLGDLIIKIKKKEINISGLTNEHGVRCAVRSWYIYHGVSGQLLSAKGIGGELSENYGKRAMDKLTMEQRVAFMQALREVVISEGLERELRIWESLPYWLYYTGTRIHASADLTIENIKWNGNPKDATTTGKAYVIDKGKHRKGRQKWWKLIMGPLKDRIVDNLESRAFPQQGLLFNGLTPDKIRTIFIKAYEKANIKVHQPGHIWRHTGAQDLLDATDWNYDLVGAILGWIDTKTLKECYGKMGESVRERALQKAIGIPIKETPKYFRFLPEDLPFQIAPSNP